MTLLMRTISACTIAVGFLLCLVLIYLLSCSFTVLPPQPISGTSWLPFLLSMAMPLLPSINAVMAKAISLTVAMTLLLLLPMLAALSRHSISPIPYSLVTPGELWWHYNTLLSIQRK